jgi:hypothetical protein
VFYFFEKNKQYLQCEIQTTHVPDAFAIVMTEPGGKVRTHYVMGSEEVHRRWRQLQEELTTAGWWGPHGRD